jgi:poly(A) polymerase
MRLDPADHAWMRDAGACKVIAALEAVRPGGARFVGGCVRNALLGVPVSDIDIATQLAPEAVAEALRAAKIKFIPTGLAHGTITAIVDHEPYEITSLRHDVETDGRRAVVAFTEDWAEDAERRDFRLNALYAAPDGEIFDPTGGLEDLEERRFVFIGSARDRIREDYLRILRFFRFNAHYGRGGLDADGLAACLELKEGLARLSAERVWMEFKKLLSARDPSHVLDVMNSGGLVEILLGHKVSLTVLRGIIVQDLGASLDSDPLLRVAALEYGGPDAAERIKAMAGKLKMSNAERKRLYGATDGAATEEVREAFTDLAAAERAIMALGAQAFEDQARLEAAGETAPPPRDWRILADFARNWDQPDFPINGGDLILRGYEPGPMLGDALDDLKAFWISERFKPTREELLARLPQ